MSEAVTRSRSTILGKRRITTRSRSCSAPSRDQLSSKVSNDVPYKTTGDVRSPGHPQNEEQVKKGKIDAQLHSKHIARTSFNPTVQIRNPRCFYSLGKPLENSNSSTSCSKKESPRKGEASKISPGTVSDGNRKRKEVTEPFFSLSEKKASDQKTNLVGSKTCDQSKQLSQSTKPKERERNSKDRISFSPSPERRQLRNSSTEDNQSREVGLRQCGGAAESKPKEIVSANRRPIRFENSPDKRQPKIIVEQMENLSYKSMECKKNESNIGNSTSECGIVENGIFIKQTSASVPSTPTIHKTSPSTKKSDLKRSATSTKMDSKSSFSDRHLQSSRSMLTLSSSCSPVHRPQRSVSSKGVPGSSGLHWREEADLQKALMASLHARRHKNINRDSYSNTSIQHQAILDLAGSSLNCHRSNTPDSLEINDCLEEVKSLDSKKSVARAQRKFAQNESHLGCQRTAVSGRQKHDAEIESLWATTKANTEDFLTFLCFRGTHMLPSCLEFFKYADPELAPGRSGTSSLRSFSLDDAFSNPCTPQTPESFAWHDGGISTDCELTNARQERTTDLGVKILGVTPEGTNEDSLYSAAPSATLDSPNVSLYNNPSDWTPTYDQRLCTTTEEAIDRIDLTLPDGKKNQRRVDILKQNGILGADKNSHGLKNSKIRGAVSVVKKKALSLKSRLRPSTRAVTTSVVVEQSMLASKRSHDYSRQSLSNQNTSPTRDSDSESHIRKGKNGKNSSTGSLVVRKHKKKLNITPDRKSMPRQSSCINKQGVPNENLTVTLGAISRKTNDLITSRSCPSLLENRGNRAANMSVNDNEIGKTESVSGKNKLVTKKVLKNTSLASVSLSKFTRISTVGDELNGSSAAVSLQGAHGNQTNCKRTLSFPPEDASVAGCSKQATNNLKSNCLPKKIVLGSSSESDDCVIVDNEIDEIITFYP